VRRQRRADTYAGHAIWWEARAARFGGAGSRSGSSLAGAEARAILAEAGARAG
jgi:hypothetical protein